MAIMSAVAAMRTTAPSVRSFDTYRDPPSLWAAALTICGTMMPVITPAASNS